VDAKHRIGPKVGEEKNEGIFHLPEGLLDVRLVAMPKMISSSVRSWRSMNKILLPRTRLFKA
jgi:hypothetical protein